MRLTGTMGLLLLTCSLLGAQNLPEDPVMKARTQRAQLQGINEADLPPVPRSVTEPPPLPPPETHVKDTRGGRMAKTHVKARHSGKAGKASKRAELAEDRPVKTSKHARKSPKRAPKARKKRKA